MGISISICSVFGGFVRGNDFSLIFLFIVITLHIYTDELQRFYLDTHVTLKSGLDGHALK